MASRNYYTSVVMGTTGPTPILDTYPGANLGYSIARKLKSTATYAFRLENSTGTLDVGFVGGDADTAAAQAFSNLDAGITYLKILYDQSGSGNNATFLTAGRPQYKNGVFFAANGKPSISVRQYAMHYIFPSSITQNFAYAVYNLSAISAANYVFSANAPKGFGVAGAGVAGPFAFSSPTVFQTSNIHETLLPHISIFATGNSTPKIYVDGIMYSATTSAFVNLSLSVLFARTDAGIHFNSDFCEYVSFPTDQAANAVAMQTNINSYYLIF